MAGRIDFEHYARVVCAPIIGSPVEVANPVEGQTSEGVAAVGRAREGVQRRLIAGRIDLKDDTRARCAASVGSPVEVTSQVADNTIRGRPIRPAREGVQHGLMAGRIDFEHYARARCAATVGSPVEIGGPVEDYTIRGAPVGTAREAIQHGLM